MRSRATVILLVLFLATVAGVVASPAALASPDGIVVAQQPNEDQDTQGGEGQDQGEGEGQDNPDAETGASEEETEEGTSAEATGPPWTYQMARISLVLLVFMALGLGYLYYRLVVRRSRGEV